MALTLTQQTIIMLLKIEVQEFHLRHLMYLGLNRMLMKLAGKLMRKTFLPALRLVDMVMERTRFILKYIMLLIILQGLFQV